MRPKGYGIMARMRVPGGRVEDTAVRVWHWMKADPRNWTAVLSLPLVVVQLASEWRWRRANGVPLFSRGGTIAYMRARPLQAAFGIVITFLPEIVRVILKVGSSRRR